MKSEQHYEGSSELRQAEMSDGEACRRPDGDSKSYRDLLDPDWSQASLNGDYQDLSNNRASTSLLGAWIEISGRSKTLGGGHRRTVNVQRSETNHESSGVVPIGSFKRELEK
ncbi:hypothetical protein Acr_06g0016740 [Actinidia rufa]|uniref:Uncharacterized protein n=1 Tax=Actinidia rufa TaxID=165716 RepID=A0A7J0ETA4_9ERIC|nr:hypothetical protein Acr_06g0016740 [Actinidia rufa]